MRTAIAALVFSVLGFVTAQAAPAITVSPGLGPQTTKVTVNGTGFAASSIVEVYFDVTNVCLSLTNASGAFNCKFNVASSAVPGQHWITARIGSVGAQKQFIVRTNWPMGHGRTAAQTGWNRFEPTLGGNSASSAMDLLWRAPLGPPSAPVGSSGTPVVVNGRVYIGSDEGRLHAFDALTGVKITGFPKLAGSSTGQHQSSPLYAGGRVYKGSENGRIYAFTPTGTAVPGFPKLLGGALKTALVYHDGKIFATSTNGRIYALDVSVDPPVIAWQAQITDPDEPISSPVVVEDVVYFTARHPADNAHKIHAHRAGNGASAHAGFPRTFSDSVSFGRLPIPVVYSGRIAIRTEQGEVLIYKIQGATLLKSFAANPIISSDLVIAGQFAYGVGDGMLVSVPLQTPNGADLPTNVAMIGSNPIGFLDPMRPVIASHPLSATTHTVLFQTRTTIFAGTVSGATGGVVWQYSVQTRDAASPVVSDGIVYLASVDGYLYAFAPFASEPAAARAQQRVAAPPPLASLVSDQALAVTPAPAE